MRGVYAISVMYAAVEFVAVVYVAAELAELNEDRLMGFTLVFIKIYFFGLWLAAPLLLSFVLAIIVLGLLVGKLESWSKFDSLYWAFVTGTTVGYGDNRTLRKLSRFLSVMIAFIGLIFTGIMVALAINAATVAFSQLHDVDEIRDSVQQLK